MHNAIGFKTFNDLDNSKWLQGIKDTMSKDEWPDECHRCQQTEEVNGTSIRTKSIDRHKLLHPVKENYLVVGGVLDNICNSACQTCNSKLSTKIGSLESKDYPRINNFEKFWQLIKDAKKIFIITDTTIKKLHLKKIQQIIPKKFFVKTLTISPGEKMKDIKTINKISDFLLKNKISFEYGKNSTIG